MSREMIRMTARVCLRATEDHVRAMREAVLACVEGRGRQRPDWDEELRKDPDWRPPSAPTASVMYAAEEALRVACAMAPADAEDALTVAARDYLEEKREPWRGYRPEVPEEVARSAARVWRHAGVRERLAALVK